MDKQPSRLVLLGKGFVNIGMLSMCLSIPLAVVALAVGLIGFGWNCMVLVSLLAGVGLFSYLIGCATVSTSLTSSDEKPQNRN